MNERANPRLVRRCSIFASASAIFAMVVGLSALAGWKLHAANLYTWAVFPVRMVPNTALGFILLAVSLWLLRRRGEFAFARARTFTSRIAAALTALLGLFSLAEHVSGRDFGIDQWLVVTSSADRLGPLRPRLMSSITASDFIVLGIALLLLDWKTRRDDWPSQFLCLGAWTGSAFGLLALFLEPNASYTSMALPTVVTFFVVSSGIVCSRAPWALGGLLTSDSQGARLLRKTLPIGLLILSLIGWLISKPLVTDTHIGWVEASAGAILCSLILAGFIGWIAFIVDRGENERRKLEAALQIEKEQIDRLLDRIDEPQAEAQLHRKVAIGFAFAIILTSLLGFLSWRMAQQSADDAALVAHTNEVSTTLELTLRHLVDVETGGRGFALTGSEPFLDPYETGKQATVQDLRKLRVLVSDNAAQERQLDTLEAQVNARIESTRELVSRRQTTGTLPTNAELVGGKRLMDATRATIAGMEKAENLLLEQRAPRARAAQRVNISVIGLGSLLGVIFLSIAGATVSREIGIGARARAQVNALNADLERRVAERTAALGESEGRLAGIIQSATDSIISVDEEQRIVLFNSTAERVFLCPSAEALGQPVTRFIPQRFHRAHAGYIRNFGDTGVTNRAVGPKGALWALRADGQEFQIEASISQVVTGGKKLFTVILRDVTERVQAVEARERLAAIVDSSDDAIISKALDGTITAWNHGAEKIFGYTAAEAVGQPMAMLIPPERVTEETDILARIGRGESVEHFETIRMRKGGRRIHVSATISPIRNNSGAVVGASKVARDITERKRVEEALLQSDARRKFALETAKLGDWELDLATLQAHCSPLHDQIFGYPSPSPEWSFDIFLSHVHADDRERVRQDFQTYMSAGKPWDFQCRIVWPNGEIRWIWACGDHHRDSSGKATRISGIVEDVTERHHAEEALREKEHMLSESQRIAHVGSWSLDLSEPDGRIIWSDELYRIYGVSPQTFIPTMESLLSLVVPEDWGTMQKWVAACSAGEKPGEFEFRVTLPDGRIRFITGRGELQLDESHKPARIAGSAQDVTDRHHAEEALRESEERFHAMLNGIPQLAWMAEPDGHIFWYNQRWYSFTGTTPEKMEGWGWKSVHDPDVLPKVLQGWTAAIATGTAFEMEFPLRAADGHFGTFLTRVMPLKDANGLVTRWFGTNTDISDRKKSEEQLSMQAEELARSRKALEAQTVMFKLVLDNMGEGLIAADQDGRFLIWNDAAHKLMGRVAADLPTEQWTPHYKVFLPDGITPYPPDRLPLVRALRGDSVRVELIVQPPESLPGKFLEVTARPLRDATGGLCGGVAVLHDITERKQVEIALAGQAEELSRQAQELIRSRQELEAQTLMLESVLDSISEGLVVANEEEKFILWNPAAEKILGFGPTKLPSQEWPAHYGFFLPDTVTPLLPEQDPLIRALHGEVCAAEIFVRNPKTPEGLWIEASANPVRGKDGLLRGGVIAFRDITQQKADERQIRQLNDELEIRVLERTAQLEAVNQELEAFSYSVSHDLRAPLRHISGFSQMLVEELGGNLNPNCQRYLERIQAGTLKMGLLIDELLNLARVGRHALNRRPTELNAIVAEVITMLESESEGRRVEWIIADLPTVQCDPVLVKQIFQNLLTNALKFTRPRARATIEVTRLKKRDEGQRVFQVRDNGIGFSMKYVDKLFGVFQRLHQAEDFEGTGIGLATVQRIVQKHGGRVWAEGAVDKGATFYFTLGQEKEAESKSNGAKAGGQS